MLITEDKPIVNNTVIEPFVLLYAGSHILSEHLSCPHQYAEDLITEKLTSPDYSFFELLTVNCVMLTQYLQTSHSKAKKLLISEATIFQEIWNDKQNEN